MNVQDCLSNTNGHVRTGSQHGTRSSSRHRATSVGVLSAAKARLTKAADLNSRRRKLSNTGEDYYGGYGEPEEPVDDILGIRDVAGVVTRNHYGCLVLNARQSLFIDIDLPVPSQMICAVAERRTRWQAISSRILHDLRTVLANEKEEGFRIYRTAAGFRILATAREFEPGSVQSKRLMEAAGADVAFMDLCAIQKSFRARLTPKPWRCGMQRPPRTFPRLSADDQRCFREWLSQYDRACRDRATCQFLEHIGPAYVHERLASVIAVHDRETKALETLPLA